MRQLHEHRWSIIALALLGTFCGRVPFAAAQTVDNTNQVVGGVAVDSDGVLRREVQTDQTGALLRERLAGARASLNPKVAQTSKLRKVSLNRLEQAVKDRLANGDKATDEMNYLAGLQRIQYVFYYPDTKDIVLAGPAEGWFKDPFGRVCGIDSGRPVIELQDLIVALRAFPPGKKGLNFVGCSIDPTPEGLANYKKYLQSIPSAIGPGQVQSFAQEFGEGVKTSIGQQTIRVDGISSDTHFAQVMVEADYRMKLIGIGLEHPPVRLASYADLSNGVSGNALLRWYFVPEYQCIRVSEDKLAMQMVGDGVKVVCAEELVDQSGKRHEAAATSDRASQLFTQGFTKKFPELASKSPVYAQLRNLIDMIIAAAYIQQSDFYGMADWRMETFRSEQAIPVQTYNAPQKVDAAVNVRVRGSRVSAPVGGGVAIKPNQALNPENLLQDDGGKVSKARANISLQSLAPGQWWWD